MKPFQLFSIDKKKRFYLDLKGFSSIVTREDIKDRLLVSCAVVGDSRRGKSFLLNYFIRYMEHTYPASDRVNLATDWTTKDEDKPLQGFAWGAGYARVTEGIWIWPKLYLTFWRKQPVAIMLVDCQGMHDPIGTLREWSSLGAICTLMSSVLIYNVGKLDVESIYALTAFIEYGELLTIPNKNYKSFQKCLILVRDFSGHGWGYGLEGNKFLERILEDYKAPQSIMDFRKCFESIIGWTMPLPAYNIVEDEKYDGSLEPLSERFRENLRDLAHYLFHPERLLVKIVNGRPIQVKELMVMLPTYVNALNKDSPRKMELARDTFSRVECDLLVDRAVEMYERKMNESTGPGQSYYEPQELLVLHDLAKAETKVWVKAQPRVTTDDDFRPFLDKLDQKMSDKYKQFYQRNKAKEGKSLPYLVGGAVVSGGILIMILSRLGYAQFDTHLIDITKTMFFTLILSFYVYYRGIIRQ